LLVDEAHRIEKNSNFQFTKPEDRTDLPQVDQLIICAKTPVFFIDDKQNVRFQEIGGSKLIRTAAANYNCDVEEVILETQYRCMGSNDYLLWLESVLGYVDEKRILRKNDIFDFKIFNSPQAIYDELKKKEADKQNSARLVAGYCWPWSNRLDENGCLINDVKIGDFAMPWETHGKITRPPKGFVKWYEWAYRQEGFKQVGCIYTAQGFEFDYIGVIIGDDLTYDPTTDRLKGNIAATKDPTLKKKKDKFDQHIKNIYRALMSRGMKGCYVYFMDKNTEKFFKSRIEASALDHEHETRKKGKVLELIPYINSLPLLDMRAAADSQFPSKDGFFADNTEYQFVPVKGGPFSKDRFLIRAEGDSMEPKIPNGSLCLFRKDPGGSRNGKIVLCRIGGFAGDVPMAIIKTYHSERTPSAESLGEAKRIVLSSLNAAHKPIEITEGGDFSILGIFERLIEIP